MIYFQVTYMLSKVIIMEEKLTIFTFHERNIHWIHASSIWQNIVESSFSFCSCCWELFYLYYLNTGKECDKVVSDSNKFFLLLFSLKYCDKEKNTIHLCSYFVQGRECNSFFVNVRHFLMASQLIIEQNHVKSVCDAYSITSYIEKQVQFLFRSSTRSSFSFQMVLRKLVLFSWVNVCFKCASVKFQLIFVVKVAQIIV